MRALRPDQFKHGFPGLSMSSAFGCSFTGTDTDLLAQRVATFTQLVGGAYDHGLINTLTSQSGGPPMMQNIRSQEVR
jgi:hypothetical protein